MLFYVSYQQEDWAAFLGIAEFAANNHVSETTGASPFFANQWFHPCISFLSPASPVPEDSATAINLTPHMQQSHDHIRAEMRYAQDRQGQHAYSSRNPGPRFTPGNLVWLSIKNIKTSRHSKKLDHKGLGPFAITEIVSPHAYRLELPPSLKIDPVFHLSLLEPASEHPVSGQFMPPPPPVEIEAHEEWDVEEVLDSLLRYRRPYYLV